jgi:hypothetical protein
MNQKLLMRCALEHGMGIIPVKFYENAPVVSEE